MNNESPGSGVGMTRRRFIQVFGCTTAMAAVTGATGWPVLRTLVEVGREPAVAAAEETVVQCVCRPNCHSFCRHNVHVRGGRVVKTTLAPFPDPRYNRICLRGLSHAQRIYDPDRIKYPMKRAGERGENKWERISWDEAIATITDQFKSIQAKYGKQAVAFHHSGGNVSLLDCWPSITRFTNLIGGTYVDYNTDMAIDHGTARVLGFSDVNGPSSNDPVDWVNGKVIIIWGYNLTESNIHAWHFLADAIEAGARLVVVDPIFTITAAKAHQYVPIRPGSDLALVLSMIQVILSEKRYDEQFLLHKSCAPFLVREDNSLFLRMSDLGVAPQTGPTDPMTGQPTKIDPAVAWDLATNAAVSADSAQQPALEGAFDVNGIKVRTAFGLLKEEVDKYPPETAEKLTEVDADTIRGLARLASQKGVFNLHGFGNGCYTNGVMFGHAIATLAGVTGNVGVSGAGVGFPVHVGTAFNWSWLRMELSTNPAGVPTLVLPEVLETGQFNGKPYPIKALHISNSNPFSNTVRHNDWRQKVLPKLDLVVVQDLVFTDTARWADIILPVPHWYEVEEIVAMFFAQHPYMQHSAKAVEPLYESKPDSEILRMMAAKMGVSDYMTQSDNELTDVLFDTPLGKSIGLTYANLREKGAIKVPGLDVVFQGQKFGTPSGRVEFYVEKPQPRTYFGQIWDPDRERLPRWVPPAEAWPENPLHQKYPLVVITSHSRWRVHGQWFGVPWLRELDPEPIVRINPTDAQARSIAEGEYVEVFNDRGHAVARAVLSAAVKQGVLDFPKGWQRHQFKAGGYQELTAGHFDPVGVNASFFETLADVRKWDGGA